MTDSGDDGGFQPHPGDPWHPGWTDDTVAHDAEPVKKKKKRRRGKKQRRRRRSREEAPAVEPIDAETEAEDVDAEEPPLEEQPLELSPERGEELPEEPGLLAALEPEEAPAPAWMSDPPSDREAEPITVEPPSWVGETTSGAARIDAGFDEATEPAPAGSAEPAAEEVAAALTALGEGAEADVEVEGAPQASSEVLEALEAAAGEAPVTDYGVASAEAFEALRRAEEEPAPPGEYGVAGKEAFQVLGEPGEEDLGDWEAFAGAAAESPAPVAEPDAFEEWVEEPEAPRKRGVWPFRRKRKAEEPAEWADDGEPVPEGWFPEVDEDSVVPPGSELPETEYAEDAAYESPAASDAAYRPPAAEPQYSEPASVPGEPGPAPDADQFTEDPRHESFSLEFDDGTGEQPYLPPSYDPSPPAPIPDDRDEWVTVPVDYDPDATVEMSEIGEDDIYAGAVTTEHRGLAEEIHRRAAEETEWQAMSAAMPGVETGVVGFDDVADLSEEVEYREARRSDLGARVATGLVLVVFLFGSLFVGGEAMAVFIAAMALLGIGEFYTTLRRLEFRPLAILGYVGAAGLLAAAWFHGPVAVPVAVGSLAVLVFFFYAFSPLAEDALLNGGFTVLGAGWVAGTMAFAYPLLRAEDFRTLVLAAVLSTVAMDIGAYSIGRTMGKRALAPALSPNKSVEGLIGGALFALGAAAGFAVLAETMEIAQGVAVGLVVVVAAPLGDLAESMIKRSLGVKDMGTILPGHGGVLDRVDAFLFVLPAVWVLYRVTGLLG